jgi:hypothetical protein
MKAWLTATILCQSAVLALAQTPPVPPASASRAAAPAAAAPSAAPGSAGLAPSEGKLTPATFRCGGVGKDEQDRIKAEAPQHDLLVTFSTAGGAYVADVDVEISRGGKVVAQGPCRGPLMLVDASRGRYEIRARSGGKEQRKSVFLGPKPIQLSFVWPAA